MDIPSAFALGSTGVTGKVVKGPIFNATVTVGVFLANQPIVQPQGITQQIALNGDANGDGVLDNCPVGTVRTTTADTNATVCQLGSSGITDADGNFAITLPGETTRLVGPALIEATSGQFIDEATGNTETGPIGAANTTLRTLVPVDYLDELRLPSGGGTTITRVAVTALTEIATTRALAVANESLGGQAGQTPTGGAPTSAQAHAANAQIANLYDLVGLDIARTIPSDILDERSEDDAPAMQHYGVVNAGFSQLALSAAGDNDTLDVVAAAANDYSDGIFDGLAYGEASFPSAIVGLPGNPLFTQTSAAFASTFAQAIATLQGSSRNQSGFTISADSLTQVAEASFDSSNVLTLDNNGCVVADRNVPSGSHITVRDITSGNVTLRNALGARASGMPATRVGLVANGDPFSAATVQLRCTVANFAQGNTFLGDRGNGTISVSPRFTIRDARPHEVGTYWPHKDGALLGGQSAHQTSGMAFSAENNGRTADNTALVRPYTGEGSLYIRDVVAPAATNPAPESTLFVIMTSGTNSALIAFDATRTITTTSTGERTIAFDLNGDGDTGDEVNGVSESTVPLAMTGYRPMQYMDLNGNNEFDHPEEPTGTDNPSSRLGPDISEFYVTRAASDPFALTFGRDLVTGGDATTPGGTAARPDGTSDFHASCNRAGTAAVDCAGVVTSNMTYADNTGGPPTSFRTVTGVLSEMIINNPRAGAVTMSIPEDAVINITSLRDSGNNPISLPTPLSPASIGFGPPNTFVFTPNVFLAMLAAQGISQLDGVDQRGSFVYEISLGANVYMHGTRLANESNAPPSLFQGTCVGSPGNVGTAPSGAPNQQSGTCESITSIRGSLEVN